MFTLIVWFFDPLLLFILGITPTLPNFSVFSCFKKSFRRNSEMLKSKGLAKGRYLIDWIGSG